MCVRDPDNLTAAHAMQGGSWGVRSYGPQPYAARRVGDGNGGEGQEGGSLPCCAVGSVGRQANGSVCIW